MENPSTSTPPGTSSKPNKPNKSRDLAPISPLVQQIRQLATDAAKRTESTAEPRSASPVTHVSDHGVIASRKTLLVGNSGIPKRYQSLQWAALDIGPHNRAVINEGRELAQREPNGYGMILAGKVGTGKTALACLIGLTWLERGLRVKFRSMQDFLTEIKATFADGAARSEGEILKDLARYDLLILDDLGAERDTDWGRATVRHLIETCYNETTTIVGTTNLPPMQIEEAYQGRTYSRLREMAAFWPLNGKCYRPT